RLDKGKGHPDDISCRVNIFRDLMDMDNKAYVNLAQKAKAFDSVRWDHLDDILGKLGFGNKWRGWIRGCFLSSKALVLVNGSPTNEFHFHRGLRQGDPLSPFLFILVMESLHVSFQRLIDRGMFDHILFGKDNLVPISHLFYADDVNMQKSSLCGVGVLSSDIQSMADRYGCLATNLPFTHLGVKVGVNMSKINFWNEVVQKVTSKLSSWKAKTLSVGGRLTLIKSVLGAIPTYYMSLYKVPEGVLSHLESLRNSFFLGADVGERKITWVCWRKVMAHKQLGGLGLSGHLDCTISSPSGCFVWLGVLKAIAKLKSKGVDLLEFCKKVIGNGYISNFWNDKWLGNFCLKEKFHRCYNLEIQKDAYVAFKLSNSLDIASTFRRLPRAGLELSQFNELLQLVSSVVLSSSEDRWAWILDAHGVFSVKYARQAIDKKILDKRAWCFLTSFLQSLTFLLEVWLFHVLCAQIVEV
ncbi:RNA-directed DNA polymerase, eukaryota, partial [Tanacetum coccineum]